ncbi:hypothetical protein HII17_10305 [Thalassotalea sp. M1531]|uniref:Smp protein n=1 Tax=Thalassotalea algicola TaxID=2716224 RepID=A0A7Y0LCC5_9GAMM|nr:AhpA/YtjB family protein [Thalassotalea algicola]NMP31959.1 hypothetical protein [Thalassotalea algicola]
MSQTDLPLYPKISSIYNKILQLAIAIVLIIVLLNLIIDSYSRQSSLIERQQQVYGDDYINQAARSTLVILAKRNKALLKEHITQLAVPEFIEQAILYDETGQTIAQSGLEQSVNQIYGIGEHLPDKSGNRQPFVIELRTDKLYGYLRLTLMNNQRHEDLKLANENNQELTRLMLLMAGLVGFLLTRGLSRFSRQGYRVNSKS